MSRLLFMSRWRQGVLRLPGAFFASAPHPSPLPKGEREKTSAPPLSQGVSCCGKPANPRELTLVSDRGAQALPTPLRRERRRESDSMLLSTSFPMDFVLQQGGKPANPRELTLVSDRGAQALPTPLRRERRRESYSMPLLRR